MGFRFCLQMWVLGASFLLFIFFGWVPCKADDLNSDAAALQAFYDGLSLAQRVTWNVSENPCNWRGVVCSPSKDRVWFLRIPASGLYGQILPGSLGRLSDLRILNLRSNYLSGPLPADLTNCKQLRSLSLQHNALTGPLPSFQPSRLLTRIDLSFNKLNGSIAYSLNNLPHLRVLFLQNNNLSGQIADLDLHGLANFSVANNELTGTVPKTLQNFSSTAFSGNQLCGAAQLATCSNNSTLLASPPPSPLSLKQRVVSLSSGEITAIVLSLFAVLFLISIVGVTGLCSKVRIVPPPGPLSRIMSGRRTKKTELNEEPRMTERLFEKQDGTKNDQTSPHEWEKCTLVSLNGSLNSLHLEDLLRTSRELLGIGSVGTSYKASLQDGGAVVLKHIKGLSFGHNELGWQIERIGKLLHTNLIPLRGYYHSKDNIMLVLDFLPLGSLAIHLHGARRSGGTPLDWDTRVKIALGAARGIAYLHVNLFTHGNIKSSNVLLNYGYEALLSDYCLVPLINSATLASPIVGYNAPEMTETHKLTHESDVYSFGVLLLELLTGKVPSQIADEEGFDLPHWVQSVVFEEWTSKLFDVELMHYQNKEEEMVRMLQIATACVATAPDQRPKMPQLVRMIEDIGQGGIRKSTSKEPCDYTPPHKSASQKSHSPTATS